MLIEFNELVRLAREDQENLKRVYSERFIEQVAAQLLADDAIILDNEQRTTLLNLPATQEAITSVLQKIITNLDVESELEAVGTTLPTIEESALQSIGIKAKIEFAPATTGNAKDNDATAVATPATTVTSTSLSEGKFDESKELAAGQVVELDEMPAPAPQPKGSHYGGAPVAAPPYAYGYGIPVIAAPQQAMMTPGYPGTAYATPSSAAGVYPVAPTPGVVVIAAAPPTYTQTAAPAQSSAWCCTFGECCRCLLCCLDTERDIAVAYTQQRFFTDVMTGRPVSRDEAIGAAFGGRGGFVGAVGDNAAQRVFCNDLCNACGNISCSCAVPDCGLPADCSLPAVDCGVISDVCTAVGNFAGSCFSFFRGCADNARPVMDCLTGCAENAGTAIEALGACASACGQCASCLGECAGGVLNALPR